MRRTSSIGTGRVVHLLPIVWLAAAASVLQAQQVSSDQAAALMLRSANKAYNEGKYPFAAQRFGEFLKKYSGHQSSYWAHYGLALALREAPKTDYKAIISSLRSATASSSFPDRAFALYYLGTAQRTLGNQSASLARTRPNEAAQHRAAAAKSFEEARQSFTAAADAFEQRAKTPPKPDAADADGEWVARARCDQCEMLLRLGKAPEADTVATALLARKSMAESTYRPLALYLLGYAKFSRKQYLPAGRALSQLAPFEGDFGPHARYLLARTHHLATERPEAAAQYKAVLTGYETKKKEAQERLKNPQGLSPEQKAALTALAGEPPPDYVVRARFYEALLLCESGRFDEAQTQLAALIQKHPKSPLIQEARLRQGYCFLQVRNYAEAVKLLQALSPHPELGDRATWWLARAQLGAADSKNAPAYKAALQAAVASLRRAADLAAKRAKADPAAKKRRGEILLELGDTQQLGKLYKEAAATYQQVIAEASSPARSEEALQRQATALHLAGDYPKSDQTCQQFEQKYPRSTLLPAVLFRRAENAYTAAVAAAKNANLPNREKELAKLFGQAIRRYEWLLGRYPEFEHASLARQGLATSHYRLGRYDKAAEILGKVPDFERTGPLATVSYLLADCYIRSLPAEAPDALSAARLVDRVDRAIAMLQGFVGAMPKSPHTPDALLKLGYCQQRKATVLSDAAERRAVLTSARKTYERVIREFAGSTSYPAAMFEKAKCQALLGDPGGAENELKRFQRDPLRKSPVAAPALIRLSMLQRQRGQAAEAVKVMAQCRTEHEAALQKDPARKGWIAMLLYEQAMAVKGSGKLAEAKVMFDAVVKQFPGRPVAANAIWRAGQCRRAELTAALAKARQAAQAGGSPEQVAAANKAIDQALIELRQAMAPLQAEAENLARTTPGSQGHLRLLYEVAWCYRAIADVEIESARKRLQAEAAREARARWARRAAPGSAVPPPPAPGQIPLADVPVQPAEIGARTQYRRLVEAAPGDPLAVQARLELAEMHCRRGSHPDGIDAAVKLLTEAVGKAPAAGTAEQIRLRLADLSLAKRDPAAMVAHLEAIGKKPVGYQTRYQAQYLLGEARILQKDWAKAIELLQPFRDNSRFRHGGGVYEQALLRLGYAQSRAGQWDESLKTFDVIRQRHRSGSRAAEAYYGIGWAHQNKGSHDEAVKAYVAVLRLTLGEVAAKAQYQIGQCRLAQKRYDEAAKALLLVPYTYGFAEWSAAARCEAGRAYAALKQPASAAEQWRRVLKDHPDSSWAEAARKHLAEANSKQAGS